MKIFYILGLLALFFLKPCSALAAPPLRVGEVVIQGNKIVEVAAIQSKISSQVGEKFSVQKVRQDIRSLFNTGWFYEVRALKKQKNNKMVLTFQVREKPIVEKITYKGNKNLSKKELDEIMLISANEFLDHKKLKKSIESIAKEYEKKGYYLAQITYQTKKTKQAQKIRLVIQIQENEKIKVKRIRLMGAKAISPKELKSFMGTREAGLLSFISSAGSYSPDVLNQDLNNIRFIYMDRGYWKVFLAPPEIFVSPDKKDLSLNISIQEGDQYKAGNIEFAGDLIFDSSFLKKGLETKESEIFSYGKLQRDIKRLETKYGDKGYAFVNVIPKFFNAGDGDGKTIHVLFEIQKGKKTHIGQIRIKGNSFTRDKVIRRELKIFEGELYNETNKNRSVENIKRLGFFDEVKIIRKTITKKDDLIDMDVAIKERENTGTLDIGVSYSPRYKFSLTGKVHKFNLFGKGYKAGLDVDLNFNRQNVNINFSDPYFLDSNWYFGTDFYLDHWAERLGYQVFSSCDDYEKIKQDYESKLSTQGFESEESQKNALKSVQGIQQSCLESFPPLTYRGFTEQKISGGVTFGHLLTDYIRVLFSHRLEYVTLENSIDSTLYPVEQAGGVRNPIEAILEYDRRNDRLFPTKGVFARTALAYDGLFGKFNYMTFSANMRFYQPLFWRLVFRFNAQYGQHLALSENPVPFDRLFLLGGIGSLRGFKDWTVGPRKRSDTIYQKAKKYGYPHAENIANRAFGGTKELYTNLEIQVPLLVKARLSAVVFMDIGSAYNKWADMELRANWGLGLRMFSPVGPLRFELGFPFNPQSDKGEGASEFQFTMGLPF